MTAVEVARALLEEAAATDERRGLVLAGDREAGYEALEAICRSLPVGIGETTLVGPEDRLRCRQVRQASAGTLLGTTGRLVVVDCHRTLRPDALGASVGTVDGGGLFVLLTPDLEAWPGTRTDFDRSLAVAPYTVEDVGDRFRRRLVRTLRSHPGIGLVDLAGPTVLDDGRTGSTTRRRPTPAPPREHAFPRAAYDACLSADQVSAVRALEALRPDGREPRAVVLEADRGRGKSSAAGLCAGSLLADGRSVAVTAPESENAGPVFDRAAALLETLGVTATRSDTTIETATGSLRYVPPAEAADAGASADALVVDEAAALPVGRLERCLAADRVAFVTTIHGYEGAGRGFSVRFRDRLADSDHRVTDVELATPIRHAPGDPLEVWSFNALLLDARPVPAAAIRACDPADTTYRTLSPAALVDDEALLRQVFGLLVFAHYRTEPSDLARLLDAPNLSLRALTWEGHVVSVALLAREGDLPATTRRDLYRGERIRGHMLPDVLTSQLRDERAGAPVGRRVVRIATHGALRSRGLGSRLLAAIEREARGTVDWLGTGFGATGDLVRFWTRNGYTPVATSTTPNDRSGEHSVLFLRGLSPAGQALEDRHARRLFGRLPTVASSSLAAADPTAIAAVARGLTPPCPLELSEHEWELLAGAAFGPGLVDVHPGPARRLVVHWLADGAVSPPFERAPELLVRRVLQDEPWPSVAEGLGYHSTGECMRALGRALAPLVAAYGDETARAARSRLEDTD